MTNSDLEWRKASRSTGGGAECVEVAGRGPGLTGTVAFRDSKHPGNAVLLIGRVGFSALLAGLKAGLTGGRPTALSGQIQGSRAVAPIDTSAHQYTAGTQVRA